MNTQIADRLKTTVTLAVAALMVYALYVSRDHITHVAHAIGVPGWQAETAFVLVDLPALIGKVMQLKYFSASTRKHGRQMTYLSGSLSLLCNVSSGAILHSLGAAAWGAFVVLMFLYLESKLSKIRPAAGVTAAKTRAAVQTAQAATVAPTLTLVRTQGRKCLQGCSCGRHNRTRRAA